MCVINNWKSQEESRDKKIEREKKKIEREEKQIEHEKN